MEPIIKLGQGEYEYVYPKRTNPRRAEARPCADERTAYLSSRSLADFRRCPSLFRAKEQGLISDDDPDEPIVDRAVRRLILGEPEQPETVLDADQADRVERMVSAIRAHIFARELLASGVADSALRCKYAGHPCQGRIDWINPLPYRGIVGVKCCQRLEWFAADAGAHGYVYDMAFNRSLVISAAGVILPVYLIVAEKCEPNRCGVWQIAEHVLRHARIENERAMAELTQCRASGIWPTRFESIHTIDRL